jgi:hypothetical protein
MGCQFVHIDAYARAGARSKCGGRRHSITNILAELVREPHACSHIDNPRAPNVIFGVHPAEAVATATDRASRAVDKIGRSLRCDTPVLVAAVISWPVPMAKITSDCVEGERYETFRRDVVEWLRRAFGEDLLSCIEHSDERFPHLHALAVPPLRSDRRMTISDVHPGFRARKLAEENGQDRKNCDKAYCAAMRKFQDDFYRAVGIQHGLTRLGPKQQRLSRAQWIAQKKQAQVVAIKEAEHRALAAEREMRLKTEAAEREMRLLTEVAGLERDLQERAAAAADMKEKMVKLAGQKVRPYFDHLIAIRNDLLRKLAEREAVIAQQDEELADLRRLRSDAPR